MLPAVALGMAYVALIARITRASMLEVLAEDYMRTAAAKGASAGADAAEHALKNAAVPIVTVIGIGVALLISGVVITETVFNIPGVGRLTVDAIASRDYPIIQGVIVVFSGAYVLVNLAVDLTYTLIDPRIRDERGRQGQGLCPWFGQGVRGRRPRRGRGAAPLAFAPRFLRRHPTICAGGTILAVMVTLAIVAPLFAGDPLAMDPSRRLQAAIGNALVRHRQSWPRRVRARRVRRAGFAAGRVCGRGRLSVAGGMLIGLLAGYYRRLDGAVMRLMDGLMAIPSILLAIALVSLTHAGVGIVIVAISIPEIPRMVRLVRSVVLSMREQPYVEAAVAGGARARRRSCCRHILPSTVAPLIVQATYVCASAILIEAGAVVPRRRRPAGDPDLGQHDRELAPAISAIAPWTIFAPGIALAIVVLAVNLLGDGLRDLLDPRLARRL